jgi:hypothetical protein
MWNFYKEIFATVQLATTSIGWAIYQATYERIGPAAIFFVSMQLGALLGSLWAGQLKGGLPMRASYPRPAAGPSPSASTATTPLALP